MLCCLIILRKYCAIMTYLLAYEIPEEIKTNFEISKGERLMLFLYGALLSEISKTLLTAN